MKIANTPAGARVALTRDELEKIGRPKRGALLFEQGRLFIVPDNGEDPAMERLGGSIHNRKDEGYPFAFGIPDRHPFLISVGTHFGTEVVNLQGFENGRLCYSLPTMNRNPIRRPNVTGRPKSKALVPVDPTPAIIERPMINLDMAVQFINDRKDHMGKNFIISVDSNGYLEVLQRSGK